jgi:hypothetical protein
LKGYKKQCRASQKFTGILADFELRSGTTVVIASGMERLTEQPGRLTGSNSKLVCWRTITTSGDQTDALQEGCHDQLKCRNEFQISVRFC